jgi:hypothetical protein
VRYRRLNHLKPRHDIDPGEALKTWFRFWGSDFDHARCLVSVRQGGIVPRQRGMSASAAQPAEESPVSLGMPGVDTEKPADSLAKAAPPVARRPNQNTPIMEDYSEVSTPQDVPEDVVLDVPADEEPKLWRNHYFVVADPFIRSKVRGCDPCACMSH